MQDPEPTIEILDGLKTAPKPDHSVIRSHIELMHTLAIRAGVDGLLTLSRIDISNSKLFTEQFAIGDVDQMASAIIGWSTHQNLNLYAPYVVFRRDLPRGSKGKEEDVRAVLALVGDLDTDPGKTAIGLDQLPLEPLYVVETSKDNFQPAYPLGRALPKSDILSPMLVKPIAVALSNALNGDPGTQDVSHLWRIPGTLNWPNKKKLSNGRSPVPQLVTVKLPWNGDTIELTPLWQAVKQFAPSPSATSSAAGTTTEAFDQLPADLKKLIAAPSYPNEDRSDTAASVMWKLFYRGWSDDAVQALFEAYPNGIGGHYNGDPKYLRMDIVRLRQKFDQKKSSGNGVDPEGFGDPSPGQPEILISGGDFATHFIAPDYLIYKLMQRGFLYSFTGMTGHGKTAVALLIAVHVALGRPVGGFESEKGRVLYFAGENPDDVRMRWIRMCEVMGLDPYAVDIHFMDGSNNLSDREIRSRIKAKVDELGGVSLIVVDTSAAYFVANPDNDDENDTVQALKHAKMLRGFTRLPGRPTILVTAHPIKNADLGNLIPRGGGAFVFEVDGNFVAIRESKASPLVTIDWHVKFRGPEWTPFTFKLVSSTLERLKDSKGRDLWTVHAEPVEAAEALTIAEAQHDKGVQLLQAMSTRPGASISALAIALGWVSADQKPQTGNVYRLLEKLAKDKKVIKDGPHWTITRKGKKALEDAPSRLGTAADRDDPDCPF